MLGFGRGFFFFPDSLCLEIVVDRSLAARYIVCIYKQIAIVVNSNWHDCWGDLSVYDEEILKT